MSARLRVLALSVVLLALGMVLAAQLARPRVEHALRARIECEAARRGLVARIDTVSVGPWPLVVLNGVRVEKTGAWAATTDTITATLRLQGNGLVGRTRLALGEVTVTGPAGLSADVVPSRWDVVAGPAEALRAELRDPSPGLALTWLPATEGGRVEMTATDAAVGRLLTIRRGGAVLLDGGVLSGTFHVASSPGSTRFDVNMSGRQVRLPALGDSPTEEGSALGEPIEVGLQLEGSWRPEEGVLELPRWGFTAEGVALSGSIGVADVPRDPRLDLAIEVQRLDFARVLRTSGLTPPAARDHGPGALREGDLGSASLTTRVRGRLADLKSFSVSQELDFTPPARVPPMVEALRGNFVHEIALPGGERKAILVSPTSPDFIAFRDVPPLFVRTLLLAEDAGFFGHRGIDLSELPAAILTNWERGGAVRGASTISQQLAKNLFLSREKQLGRKLQELSLALLLEAALSKERILEIYLNIIEWGPGLHGLRPAARRYFHKEPGELTPRQMAFLVALIPGPIKYQRSFASGTLSPGFRPLVDDLLAKLRSVDALSEEEYATALTEELQVDTSPTAASEQPDRE